MTRDTRRDENSTTRHLRKIIDWAITMKAAALTKEKLSNYQYEVLQTAISGIDMKSLTDRSHHHQSSLTRAIDALVKLKLVRRSKTGLSDRRQVVIVSTETAVACRDRVEAAIDGSLSQALSNLPKSKQDQFADAMKAIADLIGPSKYEQFSFAKPSGPSF